MNNLHLIQFTERLLLIQKAFEFASEGIAIADCNQPDMPLIYVNSGFEKITGYSAEDVIGKNCRFLQGPERNQPEREIIRSAINNKTSCTVVIKNYKKNGEPFYNEFSISPIFDQFGNLTHFIGIQSDVTKRVLNEQAVIKLSKQLEDKNNELQILNEKLNYLQRTAVHDIKNPLASMITLIEIMGLKLDRNSLNEQSIRKYLNNLQNASNRMLSIINDFLEAKRLQSGNITIEKEPINLKSQIQNIISQYSRSIIEKSILLELNIDDDAVVFNDLNATISILDNLISNAIKYTCPFGNINIKLQINSNYSTLTISDSGPGISTEDQSKMFEPFQKLSNKPTGKEISTGLGLYIVKQLCDITNIELDFDSQVGVGTNFYLNFKKD